MTGLAVTTHGTWAEESGDSLKLSFDMELFGEVYADEQSKILKVFLNGDGLKLGDVHFRRISPLHKHPWACVLKTDVASNVSQVHQNESKCS